MSKEVAVLVVVDTNVIIPSIFMTTPILKFIIDGSLIPIWNQFIFDEAERILETLWEGFYKFKAGPEKLPVARELLKYVYCNLGYPVDEMPEKWPPVSRDRKDDPFLWAAVNGRAEYIITLDRKHLLRLGNYQRIPIGKPGDFFPWAIATHPM